MPTSSSETHFKRFLAGSLAGTLTHSCNTGCSAVVLSYPLDVLRVKLAFNAQLSVTQAVQEILQSRAPILNMYRGVMPTIYGMIPYAGVSFLTYEGMKEQFNLYYHNNPGYSSQSASLLCGAVAGVTAQTVSYPLEIVRRTMQVGDGRRGTFETAKHIFGTRGAMGFWVGIGIGYVKVVPMFAVSFFTYEYLKKAMDI